MTNLATLDGILNVNLTGGYVPVPGDYFPSIVGYGTRSGVFAGVQPVLTRTSWYIEYFDRPVYTTGHVDLSAYGTTASPQRADGPAGRPELAAVAIVDRLHADSVLVPEPRMGPTDHPVAFGLNGEPRSVIPANVGPAPRRVPKKARFTERQLGAAALVGVLSGWNAGEPE